MAVKFFISMLDFYFSLLEYANILIQETRMKEKYETASNCLKALAHPLRLQIVDYLRTGPKSVAEIEQFCGECTQSNISQHLGMMKAKGIIRSTREGNQMFYSITKKELFKALDAMSKVFCA
jgi:DNA-binding transcriptional ArsR family regulator